jgi:hypothetical protein
MTLLSKEKMPGRASAFPGILQLAIHEISQDYFYICTLLTKKVVLNLNKKQEGRKKISTDVEVKLTLIS